MLLEPKPQPALRLRRSALDRYALVVLAALIGVAALFLFGAALYTAKLSLAISAVLVLAGLFQLGCVWLIVREARARFATGITLFGDKIDLSLPARRGYVVHEPYRGTIGVADIEAIETRAESFRLLASTVIQRAFVLKLRDRSRVLLGADRRLVEAFFETAASRIAERLKVPVVDKGMVEGSPGVMLLWGQRVPEWTAPAVPQPLAEKRRREAANAWRWAAIILLACSLLVAAAKFL